MKNCEQFAHRIDMCDSKSGDVIEHLAYIDDYLLAIATYRAARQRWPDAYIELWQGERIIGLSRQEQLLIAIPRPLLNAAILGRAARLPDMVRAGPIM